MLDSCCIRFHSSFQVLLAKESLAAYFAKLNMYLDSQPLDSKPEVKYKPEVPYMQISRVFMENAFKFATEEAETPQKAIDLGKKLLPTNRLSLLINPDDVKVHSDAKLKDYLKRRDDLRHVSSVDNDVLTRLKADLEEDLQEVKLAASEYLRDGAAIIFGVMWQMKDYLKIARASEHNPKDHPEDAAKKENRTKAARVNMEKVRIFRILCSRMK